MKPAGFWIRSLAHLIDFVLTNGIELAIEYGLLGLVFLVRKFVFSEVGVSFDQAIPGMMLQVFAVILGLGILYYYYVVLQVKQGGTFGKRLFKIKVLNADTLEPIGNKQALIRMISYLPSYLILGCGFLMAAFSKEKRALHDVISNTVCVREG